MDGDCSTKLKDAPWKNSYDKLSVLKSRDITLQTKVHLVKTMAFPVVMYGCEGWAIKKAGCQKIDALETVVLQKTLENPLDCKEIKPPNLNGNQS